jgi:gluconate 2-dehydrogenase gamma chain
MGRSTTAYFHPVLSRRDFIKGISLLPLARLLPPGAWLHAEPAGAAETFAFFSTHQAAVVREATARIIPGPTDDPLEVGHPGAREANVVRYVDTLLTALDHAPEHIHAGGPFGAAANAFVALSKQQRFGWQQRIAKLKKNYVDGIAALDAAAGGDFTTASTSKQDQVLTAAGPFLDILYTHAIEGTYGDPVYGGNTNRVGWTEIKFPGPSQPRGYDAHEVGASDGLDVLIPVGVVKSLFDNLTGAAPAIRAGRNRAR